MHSWHVNGMSSDCRTAFRYLSCVIEVWLRHVHWQQSSHCTPCLRLLTSLLHTTQGNSIFFLIFFAWTSRIGRFMLTSDYYWEYDVLLLLCNSEMALRIFVQTLYMYCVAITPVASHCIYLMVITCGLLL